VSVQRMSVADTDTFTSPDITLSVALPMKFAAAPLASGVPTVTFNEAWMGGAQEPNASGAPCVRFGLVQAW